MTKFQTHSQECSKTLTHLHIQQFLTHQWLTMFSSKLPQQRQVFSILAKMLAGMPASQTGVPGSKPGLFTPNFLFILVPKRKQVMVLVWAFHARGRPGLSAQLLVGAQLQLLWTNLYQINDVSKGLILKIARNNFSWGWPIGIID